MVTKSKVNHNTLRFLNNLINDDNLTTGVPLMFFNMNFHVK